MRRKRTFLDDPDWLTIPWRDLPCKTYFDILIDHAVKIPSLLEEFDTLRSSSSSGTRHPLVDLLHSCQELKDKITKWEHCRKQLSRPVLIKHERTEGDTYPFDHEMSWENHLFLNGSLVYWSAQLVLSVTMSQIELFLASLGFSRPNLYASTTMHQQQIRQFALCIAQSIPYCLMPDMGALGINNLNFPICLTFAHFTESNEKDICAWLFNICSEMREQGVRIRPFDNPVVANQKRDLVFPGSPTKNDIYDSVTGVSPTKISESSGAESEWPLSPSTAPNGGSFISTFIYENPAKYYFDATEPP